VPVRRSSKFSLHFLNVIIVSIVCLAHVIYCQNSPTRGYEAVLVQRRPERWSGAYQSSRKKHSVANLLLSSAHHSQNNIKITRLGSCGM